MKTIGASAIGFSTVGTVTAKRENQFRRDVDQARKLREKTGENNKFIEYLQKKGYAVKSNTVHDKVHLGGNDGPSTQRLSSDELTATINVSAWHRNCNPDPYDVYAEYYFEWNMNGGSGDGDKDGFSVGWPASDFQYEENSATSSSNVDFHTRDNSLNAVFFKYDDTGLGGYWGDDYDSGYGGCYMNTESGYGDSSTFAGKWAHTYDNLTICGASASGSGEPSWSFCNDGKKDYMGFTQTDYSEADQYWANCQ